MVISLRRILIRLSTFLSLSIILSFVFSCTTNVKIDGSLNYTDVGNLEFKDINNVKEHERCVDYSVIFFHPDIDPDPSVNPIEVIFDSYAYVFTLGNNGVRDYNNSISYKTLNNLVSSGESGSVAVSDAVKLGGISKIKFVDYKYKRTGLFSRQMCVVLYGE